MRLTLRTFSVALVTGILSSFAGKAFAVSCESIDTKRLGTVLENKAFKSVYFFSSWCQSCREKLVSQDTGATVFIAAFDEKPAVEAALARINFTGNCFFSDGVAEKLQVAGIPTTFLADDIRRKLQPR